MKATGLTSCVLLASALVLSACGGSSSSDSAAAESYIQFYNGAPGTGNSILSAGDTSVGAATYGDVSAVVTLKPDSYTLQVKDVASSTSLLSEDMPLMTGNKALFILTQQGQQYDYLNVNVSRAEPEEGKFKLHLVNLSAQQALPRTIRTSFVSSGPISDWPMRSRCFRDISPSMTSKINS